MQLRSLELSPKLARGLRLAGFPLFYLFCLFLFARLTFPYAHVKDRIIAEFNARQTGPNPKTLEIEEVSGHWFTGIEAQGVSMVSPSKPASNSAKSAGEKPEAPNELRIDSLYGSVSVIRLLFGTVAVDFGMELGDGELEGSFVKSSDTSELDLQLDDVSVAGLAPLEEIIELPLSGVLAGRMELLMPEGKLAEADGSLDLSIEGLEVGDGKAKIRDTIALPKLRAGTLKLVAEADQGRLNLKDFSAKGPDFQLSSNGSLRLRDPVGTSLADLRVNFRFTDAYKNKNDITRGLFGAPDSKVPGLFDLDPKIKSAKGSDGGYGWRATGQVAKLAFTPSADARRTGTGSRNRRSKRTDQKAK